MEYKVSYEKKEYNLNTIFSFDLLKEILYKLIISQNNLEKEIDLIKKSNLKRDKDLLKYGKLIKENLALDDDYSDENPESNESEQENEVEENKDKNEEKTEESPNKVKELEEKEKSNINKISYEKKIINQDKKNYKDEQKQFEKMNKNIEDNNKEEKTNIDSNNNISTNDIKDINNKDNDIDNYENKKFVENDNFKKSENFKKVENQKEESKTHRKKYEKKIIVNERMEVSAQSQIPPDLIRNMAKQIKDNKKRMLNIENNLKKQMQSHSEILKKDFQKVMKDHSLENKNDFKIINEKIDELFKIKEDLEKKMEDCISKCSTIDIYNMFKDNGDGTVDAAKVMVRALEERVFKKLEFVDTRYKKDALDNMKTKNNVEKILPNVEKLAKEIEKINENLEKNNEDINNTIKEFDEQKNELKTIDEDRNNLLTKIDNLRNEMDIMFNDKINELEKKIEEFKKNNAQGASELFKLDFGNKNVDEEVIQSLEKKIMDLRKKTNDLENTLKLKNQDIEEIQNETKNIKLILDKKIAREDLKELYNMHLSDVDEINDLKDNAGLTFDEIRKAKSEITNILQKIDSINGNIVLLQNASSRGSGSISALINFEKYVDHQKLTDTLKPILKEIEKMYREIYSLNRNVSEYESNAKTFAKNERLNRLEDEINNKFTEQKSTFSKKYVDKVEFLKNIKQLEIQIKTMDLESKKSEAESWIMAKKPVGCFNCASCEANIKNVNPPNEYLAWNKYPQQDKIYRMGQGFSHMLQMMTSEFVKSIGNAEKENDNELSARNNNLNSNIMIDKNMFNSDNNERKLSASVLKINNKEQINEEALKKINNYNLNSSKSKGKVQLPRVLKFKKRLKLKGEGINNVPVSEDEMTGRNDSTEREGYKDNTSPKILKILKKKPFVKTEENLNFTQVNNSKI